MIEWIAMRENDWTIYGPLRKYSIALNTLKRSYNTIAIIIYMLI